MPFSTFGASTFGQSQPQPSSSGFGGGGGTSFGQSGQQSGGIFGSQRTPSLGAGATSTGFSPSGTSTAFGSQAKSPFGATTSFSGSTTGGTGMFGGPRTSPTPSGGGLLGTGGGGFSFGGQSAASTTGAFGASSAFGGSSSSFGQPTSQTSTGLSGLGGLSGGFGASAGGQTFGQPQSGTGNPPFKAAESEEQLPSTVGGRPQKNTNHMQVITSMSQYAGKSFEELRFEDYQRGNKTASTGSLSGSGFGGLKPGSGFGASQGAQTGFGLGGTTSSSGLTFGGSTSTPAFGSTGGVSTSVSPFGQPAANTVSTGFGSNTSTSSPFGATSGFGQTATTPSFGFGGTPTQTQQSSAFGAKPFGTSPTFGTGTGTGGGLGFGSTTGTSTAFGTAKPGGFGAAATTGGFGQPSGSTGFGTGATGFGSTPTTGFGAANTTGFGTSGFGSTPTAGGTGSFGTAPSTTPGGFGTSSGSGFGASTGTGFGATASTGTGFGATSGFGSGATGGFGTPGGAGFGTTGFGAAQGQQTSAFGAKPLGTSPAFGTGTGTGGSLGFGSTTGTSTAFGTAKPGGFGFGAAATTGGFGQPSGSTGFGTGATGFGSTPTTGFGAGASSGFGAGASTGFGATPSSSFGGGAPSTGFGGSSSFGASPGAGFGAAAGTGTGFGATSGFGSGATGGFGAPTSFGTTGFGGGAQSTGFGASSIGGGFGTQSAQTQTGFGAFGGGGLGGSFGSVGGTTPSSGFGATGFGAGGMGSTGAGFGGSGFGMGTSGFGPGTAGFGGSSFQAQGGNAFLQQQQQQQQMGGVPLNSMPSHSTASLATMFDRFQRRKHDVLEVHLSEEERAAAAGGAGGQGASQSLSLSGGTSSFSSSRPYRTQPGFSRVKPRRVGSSLTSALTRTGPMSSLMAGGVSGGAVLSPDLFRGRSANRLVIDPALDSFDPGADLPMPPSVTFASFDTVITPDNHKAVLAREAMSDGNGIQEGKRSESRPVEAETGESTGLTPAYNFSPPLASTTPTHLSRLASTPRTESHEVNMSLSEARQRSGSQSNRLDDTGAIGTQASPIALDQYSSPRDLSRPEPSEKRSAEDSPRERELQQTPPTLTAPGYYTNPDMSQLQSMSALELKYVPKFAVFRPNVGRIEWEGDTDVRGLDLDRLVRIEAGSVDVYEGVEEEKPTVGKGLNKSAVVLLHNIFPKSSASAKKRAEFEDKLRKCCEESGSEFLDYDAESGDWVFRVKHFSRYGLADDSDDEENEKEEVRSDKDTLPRGERDIPSSTQPPLAGAAMRQQNEQLLRLRRRLHTDSLLESGRQKGSDDGSPASDLRVHFTSPPSDSSHIMSQPPSPPTVSQWSSPVAPHTSLVSSHSEDPSLAAAIVGGTADHLQSDPSPPPAHFVACGRVPDPLWPDSQSPCLSIMLRVKERHATQHMDTDRSASSALTLTSLTGCAGGREGRARRPVDAALFMGRSFRVGWAPDGRLVHCGRLVFPTADESPHSAPTVHRVVVEKVNPVSRPLRSLSFSRDMETDTDLETESGEEIGKSLVLPLKAILSASTVQREEPFLQSQTERYARGERSNGLPRWRVPKADPRQLDEYLRFVRLLKDLQTCFHGVSEDGGERAGADGESRGSLRYQTPQWRAMKAVELVDACCGQETLWTQRISTEMSPRVMRDRLPLYERRKGFIEARWGRRREWLGKWLEGITGPEVVSSRPEVDEGEAGQHPATYRRIFELLSCRRVGSATSVSSSAGMSRLSLLLSQLEGDENMQHLVQSQLRDWEAVGAVEVIPEELLAVYRVLGGEEMLLPVPVAIDSDSPYEEDRCALSSLDWARALGMIFWYGCGSVGKLSLAMLKYERCVGAGLLSPPFIQSNVDPESENELEEPVQHALYSLLTALLATDTHTTQERQWLSTRALHTAGFTPDALDVRGSYLVLVLLESLGTACPSAASSCIIRTQMMFQLLAVGQWQWAVMVACQIQDQRQREAVVRDLVGRWGGYQGWEAHEDTSETFVCGLYVPEQWVHEATAARGSEQGDPHGRAAYSSLAGDWTEVERTVCRILAPAASFSSDRSVQELRLLLETAEERLEEAETEDQKSERHDKCLQEGRLLLEYYRLQDAIARLRSEGVEEEDLASHLAPVLLSASTLLRALCVPVLEKEAKEGRSSKCLSVSPSCSHGFDMHELLQYDMGTYLFRLLLESDGDRMQHESIMSEDELLTMPLVFDSAKLKSDKFLFCSSS